MGDTYTRQSSYTDGDVITAAHTNNEFNQLLAAFAASTGHTHDGTAAEGGPITKLLGNGLTFGAGTSGTDITITFDGETNDGELKWMEDEDYFEFSDDILVASTEKLQFRDTAIYINSSTDGQLDLVADSEIQIAATTIDINGNVDISGTLTIGSAGISEAELEILDGATVTTTELNIIDGDTSATSTTVADADRVVFNDAGTMKQVAVTDLAAYFDDEITAMPNLVTTAATTVGALNSGSITSGFGTIDTGSSTITTTGLITGGSLDIDDVVINGTTIGHTDDTDLITVASGLVTVAGEISVTTLDIGGTNVTSTAAELNILDGVTATASELNIMDGVTATTAELNLIDGGTTATSTTLAAADRLIVNDAGTMKQVALSDFETFFESALDTTSNITTVGALNSGSITSGFGTIDTGSSTITTTGLITGGSLDIDDVVINGTTIGHTDDTDLMTVADGVLTVAGEVSMTTLDIGGTNVTSTAAELNILDGVTATATELNYSDTGAAVGTVVASKVVTADANKDVASFRNITLTGELDAGSLDVSGNADIDGTLEADAMTLNGTAITTVATLSTGISNGNLPVFTSGAADNDFLRIDGTSIEGRSASEVLSDIAAAPAAGSSNIVTTGALNSGSITSGFGAINNGSSNITTTGVGTFASLDISGDIDVDGTTNLDVVDIDGAVDMASTLQVDGAITSSDGCTITTADNTTQLTLKSTDADANKGPVLDFYRNSSSPADSDSTGFILFNAENDADEIVEYARIATQSLDVTDGSEDGLLTLDVMKDGTQTSGVKIRSSEVVINDGSADIDFRVESDGNSSMLFVDAGNNRVQIGGTAPVSDAFLTTSKNGNNIEWGHTNASGYRSVLGAFSSGGAPFIALHAEAGTNANTFQTRGIAGNVITTDNAGALVIQQVTTATADNQSGTERARFDSSGDLFIAKTSDGVSVDGFHLDNSGHLGGSRTNNTQSSLNRNGSDGTLISCLKNGTEVGSISVNSSATAFNTSSDYRLKENVDYTWDATTRLKQLKPARFNFIVDETNTLVDGFIAHEVSSIVPEAINGTKDATKSVSNSILSASGTLLFENVTKDDWTAGKLATTDAAGNAVAALYPSDSTWTANHAEPVMQGIDQSKLVPLLVKTIQELEARITALEAG